VVRQLLRAKDRDARITVSGRDVLVDRTSEHAVLFFVLGQSSFRVFRAVQRERELMNDA